MDTLTMRRAALIAIPVGLLLSVLGIVAVMNAISYALFFALGLPLLLLGVVAAIVAAWGKRG
ncbi:hypothetical protein [Arthrobacter sp. CP30]